MNTSYFPWFIELKNKMNLPSEIGVTVLEICKFICL